MSGLQITVTSAGYAALVNAQNTGTNSVRISQVGVTPQGFAPHVGMSTLPGEIKRLSTFAGAAVADDTVHVTIRDDSSDTYSLRGIGLYLDDGTLFGVYGQADAILEKSAQAMLLLATDIRFVNIQATSLTFGDTNWINPPATTEVQGVVELATSAEAVAGSDAIRAVTPAGLRASLDDRLGAGAPSSFMKGLLGVATASLFRAAIGLGNASLRNEGSGNGLDADLLDGQHGAYYLDWNNLTNRPATFAPSAHGHVWADLTGVPQTASRWPTWSEVTEKPTSFAAAPHTHSLNDLTQSGATTGQVVMWDGTRWKASTVSAGATPTNLTATVTSTNVTVNSDTGTDATIPGATASAAGVMTAADKAKLDGIATNATNTPLSNIAPAALATSASAGVSASAARADHVHPYPTAMQVGAVVNDTAGLNALGMGWIGGQVRVRVDSTTFNLWHTGNFDPATKANLSGATFTGPISAPTIQATSSDARLKAEISDLRNALALVLRLRPRRWRWRKTGEADFGYIAQEHREVLPEAVHEADDGMLYVRYGKAEALLVGAVQELAARLAAVEAQLATRGGG